MSEQKQTIFATFIATHSHLLLALILVIYLVITGAYSIINPLFEAPDEHWHFFTAEYIAQNGRLPYVAEPYDEWLSQEAAQPPLYYIIGGLLIRPINTANAREQVWLNPFAQIGYAAALTNINLAVHTPAEAWPWQGYALAAHLLRGFSTLLGLGTLLFIYGTARLCWPDSPQRALLAVSLAAFLPQFNFVHASITNDTLITFLAAAAIWQIVRLWQQPITFYRLLWLGITIGLAILSKNAGVLLLAYGLGVLVLVAIRERRFRLLFSTVPVVLLPAIFIGGWLWWRNWQLYGDPTAANQFVRLAGGDRNYSVWQVLSETPSLWLSFFGVFGWFNLRAPNWVYWIWNGVAGTAVLGTILSLFPHHSQPVRPNSWQTILKHPRFLAFLLAGWVGLVYAGLVAFMMRTPAAQGRLLFPAIVPLMLGLAWGISQLGQWITAVIPLFAFTTTFYCLLFTIRPAYTPPPLYTELPNYATPLQIQMEHGLTLVGIHVETPEAQPGEPIWLTLYWQADRPITRPPEFVLDILGRGQEPIAHLHSYHGRGLYPANLWPTGKIVADRFAVRIDPFAQAPVMGRFFVRLVDSPQAVPIGEIKITPTQWPKMSSDEVLVQIGDGATLTAVFLDTYKAQPGDTVHVYAMWQITANISQDYTTLIHLGPANQAPIVTGDSPPLQGDYPTHLWAAGEIIEDEYTLQLPDDIENGRYPVWIGMYDPNSLTRLPLFVQGERQPNDVYLVGWLEINAQTNTP